MKLRWALIISGTIHLFVGLLLFYSFLSDSQNERSTSSPTVLTFRLSPSHPYSSTHKRKLNWGGISKGDLKNWNFQDRKGQTFHAGSEPPQEQSEVLSGADGFEVFRRMGMETSSEIHPFLGALRERIQGEIEYPQRSVDNGDQGLVIAQFEVNPRGQLLPQTLSTQGESPKLNSYVETRLGKILTGPLPRSLWSSIERLRIIVVVSFKIFPFRKEPPQYAYEPIIHNMIQIHRYSRSGDSAVTGSSGNDGSQRLSFDLFKTAEAVFNFFN